MKEIEVSTLEIHDGGDAGIVCQITCSDCGQDVTIAEMAYWNTKCLCKKWRLKISIVAVGEEIESD